MSSKRSLAWSSRPAWTIAATTRLPKSKAYRTLRSLQEYGFIDHLGHSGYRLGSRSVALASLIGPRPALLRAALPMLNRLPSTRRRDVVAAPAQRRSSGPRPRRGSSEASPFAGSVMYRRTSPAHLRLQRHCHPRPPPTPGRRDRSFVAGRRHERRPSPAQLSRIRSDGYALSFSDNHVGIHGIAAPLLDPADRYPLGSVAVAGADHRLPAAGPSRSGPTLLKATCKELAPQLARVLGPKLIRAP